MPPPPSLSSLLSLPDLALVLEGSEPTSGKLEEEGLNVKVRKEGHGLPSCLSCEGQPAQSGPKWTQTKREKRLDLYFVVVVGHVHCMWTFPGLGLNLRHSSHPSSCSDEARSSTCITQELQRGFTFK